MQPAVLATRATWPAGPRHRPAAPAPACSTGPTSWSQKNTTDTARARPGPATPAASGGAYLGVSAKALPGSCETLLPAKTGGGRPPSSGAACHWPSPLSPLCPCSPLTARGQCSLQAAALCTPGRDSQPGITRPHPPRLCLMTSARLRSGVASGFQHRAFHEENRLVSRVEVQRQFTLGLLTGPSATSSKASALPVRTVLLSRQVLTPGQEGNLRRA